MILKLLKFHMLTLSTALLILFLSLTPIQNHPEIPLFNIPYFDKIVHFGFYFVLSYLFFFENTRYNSGIKPHFILPVLLIILFGGIIELLQIPIRTRSFEALDLLVNTLGSLFSAVVFYSMKKSPLSYIFK